LQDWKNSVNYGNKDSNIKKVEIGEKSNECKIEKIINLYLKRSLLNFYTIIGLPKM